ncbi:lactosylceramide 1,3-N-acetyl-beta-D-glucosaminyltransferase-like, partial [Mizuhopecten yessoensis]|uniref:lactosylceramide 1,3-N-acetyl-beta-D-glucosaminyltransferase-like n=1 Tax=Mizuhopecten yessoensis TaxID=6573 RepID=UPI000B45C24B
MVIPFNIYSWFRNRYVQCGRRRLTCLVSLLLLLGGVMILIEVSLVSSRYELVKVHPREEVVHTEEIANAKEGEEDETVKNEPNDSVSNQPLQQSTQKEKFSYPLNVNISEAINQKSMYGKPIPYIPINLHIYEYLNRPPDCKFPNGNTKNILVFIKSPAMNIEQRIAVRAIWRQVAVPTVKRVFTLGRVTGPKWRIEQESRLYNDILQETFDDQLNDTLKIVMSYNWAVKYCPMADLLLFLNDNFYVEYNKIAAYLRFVMETKSRNVYIGKVVSYVPPYRDE